MRELIVLINVWPDGDAADPNRDLSWAYHAQNFDRREAGLARAE